MEVPPLFALQIFLFFATKVLFTLNCTKPLFLLNIHYGWNLHILLKKILCLFSYKRNLTQNANELFFGIEMAATAIMEKLYTF